MESWITAIKRASYEALRAKLYKLQKKLISITGQVVCVCVCVGTGVWE